MADGKLCKTCGWQEAEHEIAWEMKNDHHQELRYVLSEEEMNRLPTMSKEEIRDFLAAKGFKSWDDFVYDSEIAHPCDIWDNCSYTRPIDTVCVDVNLLNFYKSLIKLRNTYPTLRRGTYKTHYLNDEEGVFTFIRQLNKQKIIAIFNSSNNSQFISNEILPVGDISWKLIAGDIESNIVSPKSFAIFINQ